MSKELMAQVFIPGKIPDEVYQLLTEAQHLQAWFAEFAAVDLPGNLYNFWGRFTPGRPLRDAGHAIPLSYRPPQSDGSETCVLSLRWNMRGVDTQVEYRLAAQDSGTLVSVRHSGLAPRSDTQWAAHDLWIVLLENLRLYTLTGRAQEQLEFGPKPGPSILLAVDVHGPIEEVYSYLIDPMRVARLWDDSNVQIDPAVGGVYDYGWKDGGPRRILALDPPRMLSFSWLYPPETQETIVTWRLQQRGAVTRLSLEHAGFAADYDDEGYRAGWFSFLALIKGLVELGAAWSRVSVTGMEHGTT